jgi:hypothetical protein
MEYMGKPIEVNRKFIRFVEEEVQPEYERVLEILFQQLKENLDNTYSPASTSTHKQVNT